MTHLGYILAAYGASALVLGAMTAWVAVDLARQKRKLRRLESEGAGAAGRLG